MILFPCRECETLFGINAVCDGMIERSFSSIELYCSELIAVGMLFVWFVAANDGNDNVGRMKKEDSNVAEMLRKRVEMSHKIFRLIDGSYATRY